MWGNTLVGFTMLWICFRELISHRKSIKFLPTHTIILRRKPFGSLVPNKWHPVGILWSINTKMGDYWSWNRSPTCICTQTSIAHITWNIFAWQTRLGHILHIYTVNKTAYFKAYLLPNNTSPHRSRHIYSTNRAWSNELKHLCLINKVKLCSAKIICSANKRDVAGREAFTYTVFKLML